ncbi:retrovirus-related pol polyprotein from transposon TNT 1-94 [Tanacetum coccineum]
MNNKDVHEDYLKRTIENTDTIRGLVERARKQNPSESLLDSAYKFTKHVESSKTPDSNTHVFPSAGLKSSTSASRSQPTGNKKNDRISQTPSSNMKNKVEILREFYENIGISHQTSVARTPQQNEVVERRNWTLVEAARTMLIFLKATLFLWAEAINTACYTHNRSLIRLQYNKTPYELMHDKKPDLSFLHVFGSLCYPTNDSEDLGKLNAKADIGIFVGYTPQRKLSESLTGEHGKS